MSNRQLISSVLSLILLASTSATSATSAVAAHEVSLQTQQAPAKEEAADDAKKTLRRQALALLADVIAETRGLKLVENRARTQAIAAGLLWPHDEEAARALFKEATDGIVQLAAAGDPADPQNYNTLQTVSQLRNEMMQMLAPRDAKLALDFLRATRQPTPYVNPGAEYRPPDMELALEMQLAAQVAAQDPKMAIRMAEESLSKGISSNLLGVVYQINSKDPEAASKLAGEIIKKLRPEDLARDYEAGNVATQLLNMTRVKSATPAPAATSVAAVAPSNGPMIVTHNGSDMSVTVTSGGNSPETGVVLDESLRRELIEAMAAAALGNSPNRSGISNNLLNALRPAMADVEKYAPTRLAPLRRRMAETERSFDGRGRIWKEYGAVMQEGSIEALLEAAPKAPRQVRDQLYTQAAWKAIGENNLDRARQVIENISNPQQRAMMLRDIDRQMPWRAAERGNFEEARQMVSRFSTIEERVAALIQIASAAQLKGDKAAARRSLDDARDMVVGRAHGQTQFSAQLDLARAYSTLDAEEAFAVVESAVGQLNELLAAAAVVDGFGLESFKDGELRQQQGGYIWNDLISRCAAELATLAPVDFERARTAARKFQRPDARTLAQLLLAQNVLTGAATPGGGRRINDRPFLPRPVIRGR
ncbi:MAG TPA: hypothetical protein VM934_14660 [Pyrinomonadaceae bacterium]|nr:hypothetical protein [Pyrinomonadaceae bacterium]